MNERDVSFFARMCVLEIFMRYVRWLIIRNGPGRVEQDPPAGLLVN